MEHNTAVDKPSQIDLVLGEVYRSNKDRLLNTIKLYKTIYQLGDEITFEADVSEDMFDYCEKRTGLFVLVAVYGIREGIFLLRVISERMGWELPGTSVQPSLDETLQDAVFRVIEKTIPGIEVGELEPVAVIKNTFKYKVNAKEVTHTGLGFMARSRNITNAIIEERLSDIDIQGKFVITPDKNEIFRYANEKIFEKVIKKLQSRPYEAPEEEITSAKKYAWRLRLHKATVSKIFKKVSSDRVMQKLLKLIGPSAGLTFLDVACGDNEFVYTVAEKGAEFCVANDVAWQTVCLLMKQSKRRSFYNVFFTNHNVVSLPFAQVFDVVLCKNVLHHMRSPDEFRALLKSLERVCKEKLIIVEIEDTEQSGIVAKLLHKVWYNWFLGDVGKCFFTRQKFNVILTGIFNNHKIEFEELLTLKGRYLFAIVSLKKGAD